MTDKSELKLADGSRWVADSSAIDDITGVIVRCGPSEGLQPGLSLLLESISSGCDCWAVDALAAIRAVDGDPEYLELKRLRAAFKAADDPRTLQLTPLLQRLRRLRKHMSRLGFDAVEIERIATGNEIESDNICPQTLVVERELDRLRAEYKALAARCDALTDRLAGMCIDDGDGFP